MSDLWSVTVPGYLTGFGTVLLVGVTAVVMHRDRRKDQLEALRDARKIYAFPEERPAGVAAGVAVGYAQQITVVNAGPDPIFDVLALGNRFHPEDVPETNYRWNWTNPVSPFVRLVLPGQSKSFEGEWLHDEPSDRARPVGALPGWSAARVNATVWWTDGRGLQWERIGSAEPRRTSYPGGS